MVLTIIAYVMLIVFMYVIMTKKVSPLTGLVIVPLAFVILALALGAVPAENLVDGDGNPANVIISLGEWVKGGISTTANTGIMILFAVIFFSTMMDAGLFDPITKGLIRMSKGDPLKIIVATAIIAGVVSLNGDGTTTALICCTAFVPIYKKLNMNMMNLGVLVILQNTILNLVPWSGPTSRAMAVLGVGSEILSYLLPGMVLALAFMICIVAPYMGKKERKRLGITELSSDEIEALIGDDDPEAVAIQRPKLFVFNAVLTLVVIIWLVAGSYISEIELPSTMIFTIGSCIALLVNYPVIKEQNDRIEAHGGDAVQAIILVFAAGAFMGLLQGSGMSDAIATSLISIIPETFAGFWGIIVALISIPGPGFISTDGVYFGMRPALAEAGYAYGFTPMQMALASLMGQAFHLLSPLVSCIYVLLRLTGLEMGEWQKTSLKWAFFIFLILAGSVILGGHMPVYMAQ